VENEHDLSIVRWWEAALALIGLGIFLFFMLQWAIEGVIHNRKTQVVPDLHGKSLSAALDILSPLHLGLEKTSSDFNATVPIDSVLRQNPPGGTVVREDKIIRIVISQGGETVFAPNLIGLPLRNAEMLLREGQLAAGDISKTYSLKENRGIVLSQEPKADFGVARNSSVSLVISDGPPPAGVLLMPDFLRKNVDEAREWALQQTLSLNIGQDPTSLFPAGVILTQTPDADSVVSSSTALSLIVSAKASSVPTSASAPGNEFHYEVPQGENESLVRIVAIDKYGEHEVFNGLRKPGSKIDVPIGESGQARVRIFLNGILVEERNL
jgi:serine/threonine-protein kinase